MSHTFSLTAEFSFEIFWAGKPWPKIQISICLLFVSKANSHSFLDCWCPSTTHCLALLSRLIFSHQKVNICINTSIFGSNLHVQPGGLPRFVAVNGLLSTVVIFLVYPLSTMTTMTLDNRSKSIIYWWPGALTPEAIAAKTMPKYGQEGPPPWDFPIGFVND